ncbi:MAG: chromosome segregation protein SMC, partial [Oxalobacter sp.]
TELAVRRVLTREGGSTYSINGTTVRRRDIHDIFLGTGLGPRAYAIIGQGMISRIIEARPEELRTFLEEAAGVSKYKERRKETARRLTDSQENLNRVLDILAEQEQQLEKLQQQAELAAHYRDLSARRDRQQQFLWLLQKQHNEHEQVSLSRQTDKAKTELEGIRAGITHCDAELAKHRVEHEDANRALHEAQGSLYSINAEIGSLTAQIDYIAETRKRLESQITVFEAQKEEWLKQVPEFTSELESIQEKLVEQQAVQEMAEERLVAQQDGLPQYEEALVQYRQKEQLLKEDCQQIQRQIAVAANTYRNLRNFLTESSLRREKLVEQRDQLQEPDGELLQEQITAKEETEQRLQELQYQQENLEEELPAFQTTKDQAVACVHQCREALIQHETRLNALRQIAEKTGQRDKLNQWLKENQLDGFQPFWRHITSEPEWETAVETVLAERMQSIELSRLEWAEAFARGALPARISFHHVPQTAGLDAEAEDLDTLLSKIKVDRPYLMPVLSRWLHGIYTAPDLATAVRSRYQLPEGACFIVPSGHRIDQYSVRLYAMESESEGFFSRHQEISRLEADSGRLEDELRQATANLQDAEYQLDERRLMVQRLSQDIGRLTGQLNDIRFAILKEEEHQRHYAMQQEQIMQLLSTLDEESQEKQAEIVVQEQLLEELDLKLVEKQEKEDAFHETVAIAEEKLMRAREICHEIEKQVQQAVFAQQALQLRKEEIDRQINMATVQVQRAEEGIAANRRELETLENSIRENRLQSLLDKRLNQEQLLAERRNALDGIALQLRTVMEERMRLEQQVQPQQDRIVALQLKEQEVRLNAEQQDQKLREAGVVEADLMLLMPTNAKPSSLQAEITRLTADINALGPVNLAAAQELKEGRERQQYLQEQHQDLIDAVTTLEDAIKRIDRETRQQLRNTFDKVNQSLDELFPVLFGGGKSQLIMSGDEILDAGIQIMAQPPGKRNATIQLLSGGEKALTALALVFSLFQLNPAPFCLLDEVDAPLDDANTARFSSLVTKMSGQTQFLFISHNQIAMEMAEELIGVTMQEKGVSRIVSVDLSNAGEFAEKG